MKKIPTGARWFAVLVLACLAVLLISQTSLARYIYQAVNNYILESQHFYFNSSVLKEDNPTYSIADWDGVNPYTLTIDVNSKKNELVSTASDITYNIEVSCPSSVICNVDKTEGIIYENVKTDSYVLTVIPINSFEAGDQVTVTTKATSTYPYTKSIEATYLVGVQNYGFSYQVTDASGEKYLTLELTNSRPYYEVEQAFQSYQVGDIISLDTYQSLSDTEKAYCISARVSISFDPNQILLDMTDPTYLANKDTQTLTTINSYQYVTGFTFEMDATSNTKIIFYKPNIADNYNGSTSVIQVNLQN